MKTIETLVFGASLLLLTSLVIAIIVMHTNTSETFLENTQEVLEVEDRATAMELGKYLECESTGADVIECIRTLGEKYSIDVCFPTETGVFEVRTITEVNNYLDPMNQVVNGSFHNSVSNYEGANAWIDSNVKYYASYKKAGSSIVGLRFTPLDGEVAKYNYNGNTLFTYFNKIEELRGNYNTLARLQTELDSQLSNVEGISGSFDYGDKVLTEKIENLYHNYSKVYAHYGVNVDDKWDNSNKQIQNAILSDVKNVQTIYFFHPEWEPGEALSLWEKYFPDMNELAKPCSSITNSSIKCYKYEIDNIFGTSIVYVPSEHTQGIDVSNVSNNKQVWNLQSYAKNNNGQLQLMNGTKYNFVNYDDSLYTIKSHFVQGFPSSIASSLDEALIKMSDVDKEWNRWNDDDRERLSEAKQCLLQARTKLKDYYNSYVECRIACENLQNKSELPECVITICNNSGTTVQHYTNTLESTVKDLRTDSQSIIYIDHHLNTVINNNDKETTAFFGSGDNAYLNTSLVIMNKSVDVSALRDTSTADNDYKDYIDNAIKEIDQLLARKVD